MKKHCITELLYNFKLYTPELSSLKVLGSSPNEHFFRLKQDAKETSIIITARKLSMDHIHLLPRSALEEYIYKEGGQINKENLINCHWSTLNMKYNDYRIKYWKNMKNGADSNKEFKMYFLLSYFISFFQFHFL